MLVSLAVVLTATGSVPASAAQAAPTEPTYVTDLQPGSGVRARFAALEEFSGPGPAHDRRGRAELEKADSHLQRALPHQSGDRGLDSACSTPTRP